MPRRKLTADCELTQAGIEAALDVSETLDREGPTSARQLAEEVFGWRELGSGVSRHVYQSERSGPGQQMAFDLPESMRDTAQSKHVRGSDPCVIKVATPGHGQTRVEIEQWLTITSSPAGGIGLDEPPEEGNWSDLRPYIAPLGDFDGPKARWLTMLKLDPMTEESREQAAFDLVENIQRETGWYTPDLHDDNVAFTADGTPYVVDYGHEFTFAGWTDNERLEQWREALETIGCRDVAMRRRRRVNRVTTFRSPLRLPGLPFESEDSQVDMTQGGRLVDMTLHGSIIPTEAATRRVVENVLDEVLDDPATLRRATPKVEGFGQGWVPKVTISASRRAGPRLSETEAFITTFYDRYDAAFAAVVPDDFDFETPGGSPPSPLEVEETEGILADIEEEFESIR